MNYMYRFIILFFVFGWSNTLLWGQTARQLVIDGDRQYERGNYFGAIFLYESALEDMPHVVALRYKYANACRLAHSYDRAFDAYLKVLDRNERRFPEAAFYCAAIFKMQGFYTEALRRFRYFYKNYPSDSLATQAKQEILLCEWAIKQAADADSNIVLSLLADSVNTNLFEYGAIDTKQGMLFSAFQSTDSVNQFTKIYSRDSSKHISQLLATINKNQLHVNDISLTKDEREAYFSVCKEMDGKYRCQIFKTQLKDTQWQQPQLLPESINYPLSNTTQPSVCSWGDSVLLFFTSDRPGGQGGLDIWYAIQHRGQIISIKNAGEQVNTAFDEITPAYNLSDSTLYFSSLGHGGFGGFDVFKSQGEPLHWSVPQNMQRPINSSYNDMYFIHTPSSRNGFVTSNRRAVQIEGITLNFNDVYRVLLPIKPQDSVRNSSTSVAQQSVLQTIRDLGMIQLYFDIGQPATQTDSCNYQTLLTEFVKKKSFYVKKAKQRAKELNKIYSRDELDAFFLNDIEMGMMRLQKLAVLLQNLVQEGGNATIYITAFTSPEGDSAYNNTLAQYRALCIKQWITTQFAKNSRALTQNLQIEIKNNETRSDESLNNLQPKYEFNPWATRAFFKRRVEVRVEKR